MPRTRARVVVVGDRRAPAGVLRWPVPARVPAADPLRHRAVSPRARRADRPRQRGPRDAHEPLRRLSKAERRRLQVRLLPAISAAGAEKGRFEFQSMHLSGALRLEGSPCTRSPELDVTLKNHDVEPGARHRRSKRYRCDPSTDYDDVGQDSSCPVAIEGMAGEMFWFESNRLVGSSLRLMSPRRFMLGP